MWEWGLFGFWARVWVLNEETFELERELQKKRASCKSIFFPAIFSFFKRGAQEDLSESSSRYRMGCFGLTDLPKITRVLGAVNFENILFGLANLLH